MAGILEKAEATVSNSKTNQEKRTDQYFNEVYRHKVKRQKTGGQRSKIAINRL